MKELTNLDLYNNLSADIKTINIDQTVDYELPTALLKERLAAMDKSLNILSTIQDLRTSSFLKYRKVI
jgi:membrane-bound lytic murein transglycosylase D